jgi:hypothetical protein
MCMVIMITLYEKFIKKKTPYIWEL